MTEPNQPHVCPKCGTRAPRRALCRRRHAPVMMVPAPPLEDPRAAREVRYAEAIRLVDEGKARPQVEQAVGLWRRGFTGLEIARVMEVGRARAYELLGDPTQAKATKRKHRLYGACAVCEARVYNNGSTPPKRCRACDARLKNERARQRMLAALWEWAERYGSPPTASDWRRAPSTLRRLHPDRQRQILARHRDRHWPPASGVQNAFGSWNAALEAAGLEPLARGRRREPETPNA